MKTFIINGSHLKNLDDFYDKIEKLFINDNKMFFGRNLDALNDVLWGGFGSFKEGEKIEIIWKDFEKSKKYIPEINIIEEIFLEHKNIKFKKA